MTMDAIKSIKYVRLQMTHNKKQTEIENMTRKLMNETKKDGLEINEEKTNTVNRRLNNNIRKINRPSAKVDSLAFST